MQLDADYQIILSNGKDEHKTESGPFKKPNKGDPIPMEDNQKEPLIRMYGVTM